MLSTPEAETASILRMPAAIELSERIRIIPILPEFSTWVPPQNSIEEPYLTTLTLSPYFSQNSATAPIFLASSIGSSRSSSNGKALRTFSFTLCSTSLISSGVSFW